jgi:hypothetical protein
MATGTRCASGAPPTRSTVRRIVASDDRPLSTSPTSTCTVTRHGADGGTKSSGVTSGSTKRIAAIGASSEGSDQSPSSGAVTERSSTPVAGAVNAAAARQARPNRSSPPTATCTAAPAGNPRTTTGNGSSCLLTAGTSRASGAAATSGGLGRCAAGCGASAVSRWSTSADRFSNHGGKSPDAKPPTARKT